MAGKKKNADPEAGEDAGKSKLKMMIGAVVLVVIGAVLGGKVLGGGGGAAAASTTTTTLEPHGTITTLDSITLNLADGRFLILGVSFEVSHDIVYPAVAAAGGHGGGEESTDKSKGFARELDATIKVMSSFSYEQLIGPEGKEKAREALLSEVEKISHGAIEDVLFHEFVMQ